jgi:outer membrane scaffolding protein for murein synthesis (MipA/OmpV family)
MYLQMYCWIVIGYLFVCSSYVYAQNPNEKSKISVDRNLTSFEGVDEKLSLWEFGGAAGVIDIANYPSSSQRNLITAALPYVVYRGEIFRAGDGNGARAVVIDKDNLEVGLSFGGTFSADSEDGTVREGMPELDFLLEIGPQAIYQIKKYQFKNGGNAQLKARLQVRTAFSTDFSTIENRGYVLNPVITYQQRGRLFKDTALSASLGVIFATEEFHDYYYEVSEQFITNKRAFYNAKGGYLGTKLALSLSFPITDSIRAFVGVGSQLYSGSVNKNSPLFEKDVTYSASFGLVWRLFKSDRKANW